MKEENKKKLVLLLREYQSDLLKSDAINKKYRDIGHYGLVTCGVKAQYEHARIIADKLDREINILIRT